MGESDQDRTGTFWVTTRYADHYNTDSIETWRRRRESNPLKTDRQSVDLPIIHVGVGGAAWNRTKDERFKISCDTISPQPYRCRRVVSNHPLRIFSPSLIHLSYSGILRVEMKGIEPLYLTCKASVIPLYDTPRFTTLARHIGFDPITSTVTG